MNNEKQMKGTKNPTYKAKDKREKNRRKPTECVQCKMFVNQCVLKWLMPQ